MSKMQLPKVKSLEEIKFVSKVWGYERWFHNKDCCLKELFIKEGSACSWHYHNLKDEVFHILSGKGVVKISWEDDENAAFLRSVSKRDSLHIPTGLRHRIIAKRNLTIFEVSTHHEDSDSIRLYPGY